MKHVEFYTKYRTSYPAIANPIFSKGSRWTIFLIAMVAIIVAPLILYNQQRPLPFSLSQYFRLVESFLVFAFPFVALLVWNNWRESAKRSKGYGWVGKFEVINKQSNFVFSYLLLSPGNEHKIKVDRSLFLKTRIGDNILIHRDVFGSLVRISRVKKSEKLKVKSGDAHWQF
jgi:hypothetical protein